MKSFRKALLGNQEYHQNLLGQGFDTLVEEATDKTLQRPSAEANRTVILAINDPNTGLEVTPGEVSQQLRRQLRSTSHQKQWLAAVLIGDVLEQCPSKVDAVALEILEAVSVVATMDVRHASQSRKNAQKAAMEVLSRHRRLGRQALRSGFGTSQLPTAVSSVSHKEPDRSIGAIQTYHQSCRNHCDVVQGLIQSSETHDSTRELIQELLKETQQMRQILVKAVEILAGHSGEQVEGAIVLAVEAIDRADQTTQLCEKRPQSLSELTLRDMPSVPRRSSVRSLDLLGEISSPERTAPLPRRHSADLLSLEDGLGQPSAPNVRPSASPVAHISLQDPFQTLAEGGQPSTSEEKFNPFGDDARFSF